MQLIPIARDGSVSVRLPMEREPLAGVIRSTVDLYARAGFKEPWIGYLALEGEQSVGTCAFRSPPKDGIVEIAYCTFPGREGRGIATQMAKELISIAESASSSVQVSARTLPEENASVRILRRIGFSFVGLVQDPEDGAVWEWIYEKQKSA